MGSRIEGAGLHVALGLKGINFSMDENLGHFITILGVAMIVAICARKLRLPFTIGLVFRALAWRLRSRILERILRTSSYLT